MTPDHESSSSPGKSAQLTANMILGALLFGVFGAVTSPLNHTGAWASAGGGCVVGALAGLTWYWNSRRAHAYRSGFDLGAQTLTRPARSLSPSQNQLRKRYRNPHFITVSAALLSAYLILAAVVSTLDSSPGVLIPLWSVVLLPAAMVAGSMLTYLDVDPAGLTVRNTLRVTRVGWAELAEIRWHRTPQHDILQLATTGGREVKVQAVVVTDTGQGARRAARVLAGLAQAWSEAG